MQNPFPYSDTNKRYHTFDYFLRHRFGGKVAKVSLDAGFTCPNIDGSKGVGGCTYCSAKGSGDFAGDKNLPLRDHIQTHGLYTVRSATPPNTQKPDGHQTIRLCTAKPHHGRSATVTRSCTRPHTRCCSQPTSRTIT